LTKEMSEFEVNTDEEKCHTALKNVRLLINMYLF